MEVKIFIESSIAGPCVKDGWYAAIIECQTSKGPATMGLSGMEKETTYYRSVLLAILMALKKLKPCKAIIYTDCSFIKNMYENGTAEQWRRTEWTKSDGKDVANKELWQQFFDEIERLGGKGKITFQFSKHHDYKDSIRELIQKNKEKNAGKR